MATEKSDKTQSRGGFSAYLPLILALLLMPGVAYLTLKYLPGIQAARSQAGVGGTNQLAAAHATNQAKASTKRAHPRMPVPLADGYLGFAPEVPKNPGPARLILTNAPRAPDFRFALKLADTKRTRYALLELFMVSEDTDSLIAKANSHHTSLFQQTTNLIGRKTAENLLKPGARNILRSELITVFNEVLGSNTVTEILFPTFLVQ
jgi:flagellar basal body-associated protein FliL